MTGICKIINRGVMHSLYMSEGYDSISLPKSFVKKIDEIVNNPEFGYASRAEFIKEAVRLRFKEFGVKFDVDAGEDESK